MKRTVITRQPKVPSEPGMALQFIFTDQNKELCFNKLINMWSPLDGSP